MSPTTLKEKSLTYIATGKPGTPLDYGAGHVNPNKALDPGLIYDLEFEDYINYLCAINYTRQEIAAITRRSDYTCDKATLDLNYPSFMLILNNTDTTSATFKRVLTNLVDSKAVYRATAWAPSSMKISVKPSELTFEGKNSKAEFSVHVDVDLRGYGMQNSYLGNYGYLSWSEVNGKHVVKSPIVSAYALGKSEKRLVHQLDSQLLKQVASSLEPQKGNQKRSPQKSGSRAEHPKT
ncbi:hypothetical protein Sjap_017285 [Stephania japonica]|uniref:Subtilisin-like protease fibronectin type-III domain-containing protein n=1 Tax=Stephania japonica TaxID=461633 RepID=A0AAP0NK65_9MAGN